MPAGARDESEARTRRSRVDPMLKQQGWSIVPFDPTRPTRHYSHHAVTEFPTDNGPADHALFVEGQPLGIVEAKRLSLGPQNVLPQAERYSKGVDASPFSFCGYRVAAVARV
jgi:type I restriction enzyme R subunit